MITLLVIEDEQHLLEEIGALLSFENFNVITVNNGKGGVELANIHQPDIIICDITMAGMDGYEVLSELRKNTATMLIPFIFLTARSDKSFMRYGMELGADDYLTKPFTREELLAAIQARLLRHTSVAEAHKQDLVEAKTKLTRLIAHELRTPLTSIQLVKDLVEHQIGSLSEAQITELMGMLSSGTERLTHVIEQMIYITRLDSEAISASTIATAGSMVNVSKIIQNATRRGRRFAYRNKEFPIKLEEQDDKTKVIANASALEHAIAEVISNALNFSPQDSHVTLTQSIKPDVTYITIRDYGPGMSIREKRLAMEPFEQINREMNEQQGMGIGLAVAQRIIEAHGGRIEFPPVLNGTQVNIRLPIAKV